MSGKFLESEKARNKKLSNLENETRKSQFRAMLLLRDFEEPRIVVTLFLWWRWFLVKEGDDDEWTITKWKLRFDVGGKKVKSLFSPFTRLNYYTMFFVSFCNLYCIATNEMKNIFIKNQGRNVGTWLFKSRLLSAKVPAS